MRPTARDDELRAHPLPKGFPNPLELGLLPTMLSVGLGAGLLGIQVLADDPEGVRCDFDFEHVWPAYLQAIKNKSSKEGALVARTLEKALAK